MPYATFCHVVNRDRDWKEVLERLKGSRTWNDFAHDLNEDVRNLMRWKSGKGQPGKRAQAELRRLESDQRLDTEFGELRRMKELCQIEERAHHIANSANENAWAAFVQAISVLLDRAENQGGRP